MLIALAACATAAALLLSAACSTVDNVQACQDWLDATFCGDFDFSSVVDCNQYENINCDIADYFQCLEEKTVCDGATGVADTSDWPSCQSQASCD
jgi:hypothetical protein